MAADGASGMAAAGLALKYGWAAKLTALIGVGTLSALLIAAIDPAEAIQDPKKRRKLILVQAFAAGIVAPLFTPATVRWIDSMLTWVDTTQSIEAWAEIALPVGLLWGSLSWGILGAMVKLRQIVRDRAAGELARRVGISDK